MFSDYAINHTNKLTTTEISEGFCPSCIDEQWRTANTKQILYKHALHHRNETEFVCFEHVGCREAANIMRSNWIENLTSEEIKEQKKELGDLINEGELIGKQEFGINKLQ